MNKKKLINALYRKFDTELTDEELMLGESYKSYVSNVADGLTSKYGAATKVAITADASKNGYSAYTDGDSITINAWCDHYKENTKDLKERHWCVLGRVVHECGHLLWSNFKLAMQMGEEMELNGKMYPAPSSDPTEVEDYLKANPHLRDMFAKLTHEIANCVEDGFIEKLLVVKFPGYGQYLKRNREFLEKDMKTVKELRADKFDDISIIISLVLYQAKFYHVPDFGDEASSDVAKLFYDIRETVNDAVNEMSSYHRMSKVNDIMLKVFTLIKDEANKQNKQNGQGGKKGNQNQNNKGQDPQNQNGQKGNEQNQNQGQNQGQNQSGQGQQQNGSGNTIEQMIKQIANNLASSAPSDKTEHKNASSPKDDQKSSTQLGSGDGASNSGIDGMQKKADENSSSSSTLEQLKKNEVTKKVEKAVEQQIQNELKKDLSAVTNSRGMHNGIPAVISRASAEDGESDYNAQHEVLDVLARRMMKNLLKEIKDRQLGDALDGNYFGNRLDTNNLYRRDKKLYIRDILPEDVPDMEVSVLIDCSGSMGGEKMDTAVKTAYTVWKFCQLLKIPVTVLGHNTSGSTVRLQSVADGDSIDGKDGCRIFSLHASGCNRDGYALRYALNKLSKSPATDKIMFVISDGQPNHRGYGAAEGLVDIRDAVAKAKKDGISVITAGIGSSASAIRSIWIDGVSAKRAATFLELEENLERLPKTFVGVIKKQLELSA